MTAAPPSDEELLAGAQLSLSQPTQDGAPPLDDGRLTEETSKRIDDRSNLTDYAALPRRPPRAPMASR